MSKGEIGAFLPDFSGFDKASVNPRPVQVKADRRRAVLDPSHFLAANR
jgi:hypothetical protein